MFDFWIARVFAIATKLRDFLVRILPPDSDNAAEQPSGAFSAVGALTTPLHWLRNGCCCVRDVVRLYRAKGIRDAICAHVLREVDAEQEWAPNPNARQNTHTDKNPEQQLSLSKAKAEAEEHPPPEVIDAGLASLERDMRDFFSDFDFAQVVGKAGSESSSFLRLSAAENAAVRSRILQTANMDSEQSFQRGHDCDDDPSSLPLATIALKSRNNDSNDSSERDPLQAAMLHLFSSPGKMVRSRIVTLLANAFLADFFSTSLGGCRCDGDDDDDDFSEKRNRMSQEVSKRAVTLGAEKT